jgi:hypothetical protein
LDLRVGDADAVGLGELGSGRIVHAPRLLPSGDGDEHGVLVGEHAAQPGAVDLIADAEEEAHLDLARVGRRNPVGNEDEIPIGMRVPLRRDVELDLLGRLDGIDVPELVRVPRRKTVDVVILRVALLRVERVVDGVSPIAGLGGDGAVGHGQLPLVVGGMASFSGGVSGSQASWT